MIRTGAARALLRWVQTLPDEQVVTHPELAVAAATAALMIGQTTVERRRLLDLARRAEVEQPRRFSPYVRCTAAMVRAAAVDCNVQEAVLEGRTAVALAETDADETLVAAYAGLARALYLAGELDEAWAVALRAIGHPDVERRVPGHAFARSTLALVAAERGRIESARAHAEKARSLVGGVASSRSWLGANASAALGIVLAKEGSFAEAERELAYAERFCHDDVATVHHAWILCALACVRSRRGRLEDAQAALRAVNDELGELEDAGRVPALAAAVELELRQAKQRADGGAVLVAPSKAEIAVLRLLGSDLSAREIASALFLSANTVRSHTRSIYRKLGVNSRAGAVARAEKLGLLDPSDQPA
jgi:LuxR family transcriptional regulator, maltose regulon positive regulatory protein